MTPYGDGDLGQHWLGWWLVAWGHRAITWTNVDLLPKVFMFCGKKCSRAYSATWVTISHFYRYQSMIHCSKRRVPSMYICHHYLVWWLNYSLPQTWFSLLVDQVMVSKGWLLLKCSHYTLIIGWRYQRVARCDSRTQINIANRKIYSWKYCTFMYSWIRLLLIELCVFIYNS